MASTAHTTGSGHPIRQAIACIGGDLAGVVDAPTWSLNTQDTREVLVELARAQARLVELEGRVLAHADQVGAGTETGATSTANWLAHATNATRPDAHRRTRLAAALHTHGVVRDAMAAGHVLVEQAHVITRAVEALPDDDLLRARCEKHLVALAEHHDAKELRVLGRRVLEVVDPDLADVHEARLLEAQERDAEKSASFWMREDGHGKVHGRFTIPTLEAEQLRKALMALAAPKHQRATGGDYDHTKPSAQRLGQALCDYISRYPVDRLPKGGGIAATVMVTMTIESLLGGLKAASIDTGESISAGLARRLACEAGIVPAVLGTTSQVLDLGRRTRFHTEPQRLAVTLEQQHCQHPGCDIPAALCHVHHTTPWSRGGTTNTRDAQLLCPSHHSLAHRAPPMRT